MGHSERFSWHLLKYSLCQELKSAGYCGANGASQAPKQIGHCTAAAQAVAGGDVIGLAWVSAGFNENLLCNPFRLHFASVETTRGMQCMQSCPFPCAQRKASDTGLSVNMSMASPYLEQI